MTRGIRARLLLAFFLIGSFAVVAAAAAVYAFLQVATVLGHITDDRVPSALGSLELSRQAERLVAAAPQLLNAGDDEQHESITAAIQEQVAQLRAAAARLTDSGAIHPASAQAIDNTVELLSANLLSLDDVVASKLIAAERKAQRLRELARAHTAFQRFLTPEVAVMEGRVIRLRSLQREPDADPREMAELAREIAPRLPLQSILLEASVINDTLQQAAAEPQLANLHVLQFPLLRALDRLDNAIDELPEGLRARLTGLSGDLRPFIDGPRSVPRLRELELTIREDGEFLLQVNTTLSAELTRIMNDVVDAAKNDIAAANREALSVQRHSTNLLLALVALILLSSVLIVWLYVDRSLLSRLRMVSDRMRAIASGNLGTPVPAAGADEIGQMAAALEVFRKTAVQVERTNLREIESARRRLTDAIESVSDGFALFDADDRLVVANSRYLHMLGLVADDHGRTFEEILEHTLDAGLLELGDEDPASWRARRLAAHRAPRGPGVLQFTDGRWMRVNERRTEDGNTVGVYSDVSELKRRELELAHANRAKDQTLAELTIVLDAIDYGVLFMDADLRVRLSNRKFREIWRVGESFFASNPTLMEIIEYSRQQGVLAIGRKQWAQYVETRMHEVRSGNTQREMTLADGTILQHQCLVLPEGGRMLTYFDITPLKRRERELAEVVQQKEAVVGELQAVLDAIDYGIVFADAGLRVRLTNKAFRNMWDVPEALANRPVTIRDLIDIHRPVGPHQIVAQHGEEPRAPDAPPTPEALAAQQWEDYVRRRLDDIRKGSIPHSEMRTPDGRTFIYQCVALPEGGRMLTYFDVTPLKKVEQALRESEERYSLAMRGANEGLWEWKAGTGQVYVSPRLQTIACRSRSRSGTGSCTPTISRHTTRRSSPICVANASSTTPSTACSAPTASTTGCRIAASACDTTTGASTAWPAR